MILKPKTSRWRNLTKSAPRFLPKEPLILLVLLLKLLIFNWRYMY